jgi:hypothetical protein
MGRTLVVAASASLIAGVAVGAVARFLMRLVAVATGNGSSFSWSGTAFIIGLFVVVMFPGALLAAASSRRSRWVLLAAGAAFLFVPATGIAMEEVGSTAGFSAARWAAVLAASAGVYAAIALLPLVTLRLIDTFLPRAVGRADFSTNTRPQ